MEQTSRPENKMGTMPVNRLLVSMSLPMMLSMLVQALYNVADSMFVARLSENALNAVSLSFPVQNLMIALAIGTCVGVNALLSRSLGEGEFERANQTANHAIILGLLNFLVFVLIGLFAVKPFFRAQTDVAEIIANGYDYLTICSVFSFGLVGQIVFSRLLQSTGKTFFSMIVQLSGAVVNVILDPILIFGLLGFPRLEVAGAAIATVIGQTVAMLVGFLLNQVYNKEINLSLKGIFRPNLGIIRRIYAVGAPTIAMNSISSVMTFGLNKILISFTPTATAFFGIYFKLQSFVFMPVFGLNNGTVSILAYNYGAKRKSRLIQTYRLAVTYSVSILLLGLLLFQLFPAQLLGLFNASEEMLAIGIPALRIISLSYLFPGFCIITLSSFQALGHGVKGFIVSVVRQLVFLLPVAFLLSLTGRLNLVWFAFPISELVTVILSAWMLRQVYRQEILTLPDET